MKSYKLKLVFCLVIVLNVIPELWCSMGTQADYFDEHLAPKITKIMQEKDIPGLSIAVVRGNDLVYAEGFGLANKEKNIPATPETVYGLGSISKVFTATAFMKAVEDGLIDPSRPVTDYLPLFDMKPPLELPEGYNKTTLDPITPYNLMIHYAGMPLDAPERPEDAAWTPQTLEELMHELTTESRLIYPPNFRYSYSNPGIAVLGRILEVISKENFEEHMQRVLLKPLDMTSSTFSNTGLPSTITKKLAQGYSTIDTPINRPPIRGTPAGGLYSNVLDVANFIKMYFNDGVYNGRQLLKPETIKQMFTVQNEALKQEDPLHKGPDQGLVWGLNIFKNRFPEKPKTASHGGSVVGFSSTLILLPEEKIGVILLTNLRGEAEEGETEQETVKKIKVKPAQIAIQALKVARENDQKN